MPYNVPISLFAFPVNVLMAAIWAVVVIALWRSGRESGFVRFMLSPSATYLAVSLFIIVSLVVGLTGCRWIVETWPFVVFILYFQTVLAFVILRGWRIKSAFGIGSLRWRFLLLHAGLLLTIGSAFWGAPDSETLKLQAFKGIPVSEAYREDGSTKWLEYALVLDDFSLSYGPDGIPSDYTAFVMVGDERTELRVNHPFSVSFGEDLYLSGYDVEGGDYCILQIVREPWRYGALAGIVMMLAGAVLLFIRGPQKRK